MPLNICGMLTGYVPPKTSLSLMYAQLNDLAKTKQQILSLITIDARGTIHPRH